jgi:hypothetical protein
MMELPERVATLEARAEAATARDEKISEQMTAAVNALWAAVEELRKRPMMSPIVTALISTLCMACGALAVASLR